MNKPTQNNETVSFADEKLVLVNEQDEVIGYGDKYDIHLKDIQRHRAFSILIFNSNGDLLVQQRSEEKPLWPLYFSNTCCSHPRRNETFEEATDRRLQEEMGLSADLHYLYKFEYKEDYIEKGETIGSEHEICRVYVGVTDDEPNPNRTEVKSWRTMTPAAIDKAIESNPEDYSPWFKMEWLTIREYHWHKVEKLLSN